MMVDKKSSFKSLKRLLKRTAIFAIPILVLLGIGWHILRSDQAFVIRKVEETALELFDINLQVGGYRLEWTQPFPLIRIQLRNVSVASKRQPEKPFFRVNSASSEFNPWDLLSGNFRTRPFRLDSAWVHLYTDSMEYVLAQQQPASGKVKKLNIDLERLPSFTVNYLDLHQENDYSGKSLWVKFSDLVLEPEREKATDEWSAHLRSQVFFEGLVFNPAAGGYLRHTPAAVDLHFYLADEGRKLQWRHSTLAIGSHNLKLSGGHSWADTNRLHLQIQTGGITLAEVRPLLTNKLNRTLQGISVDQAVLADFSLERKMITGLEDAIKLDFRTENARVRYKKVSMSSATFDGTYSSDCDGDGVGDPRTTCISFRQLEGDFFDVLPARLQGRISNMEDPYVEASGSMDIFLPQLNKILTEKGKATFAGGRAVMNFNYLGTLEQLVNNPFDDRDIDVSGQAWFDRVRLATANHTVTSPSLTGLLSFDEDRTQLEDMELEWMGSNIRLSGQISNLPEFIFYKDETLISDLELHFDQLDLNRFRNQPTGENHPPGRGASGINGQELEALARQITGNLNGQLKLRIDKLVYDTTIFTDLSTRLQLYSPRLDAYADSAMIDIDSFRVNYLGQTPIHARATISSDLIPELAVSLYLPAARQPLNALLSPRVSLKEGQASIRLSGRALLRSLSNKKELLSSLHYRGQIQLDEIDLALKGLPGPVRRLSGPVIFDGQKAVFDHIQFVYKGATFTLDGNIRGYAPFPEKDGKKAVMDLRLNSQLLDLSAPSGTTEDLPNDSPVISPPSLFRALGELYPYATGRFELGIEQVRTGRNTIHPLHLIAGLIPDAADTTQYQFKIDSFNLGFGKGNYFRGNALVKNPDAPQIEAVVDARLAFRQLGRLLPSDYLEMRSGDFMMDLRYRSPLYDTLNAKNYLLKARFDGRAELSEGELFYNYRDFSFNKISGHLQFDEKALIIQELDLEVNGNRLSASGKSSDFFSFFAFPEQRTHIELDVRSPHFDFGTFTAPHGLGKDTLQMAGQPDTTTAFRETIGYIDQLLVRGSLELQTDLESVVYEDFKAHGVDGNISLAPDTIELHNLRMEVADGHFALAGRISDFVRHQPKIGISIRMDKNNVRELFRQFNDFGQHDLDYKNVQGRITADLVFQAEANSDYRILPETMHGDLDAKLVGGELLNIPLFDKLSGFLFRGRGMDHIILDTLEFRSHIRGSDLYVDHFHLHSSPFDFSAVGRYSLGAENNTRVLFSIPFGNLLNRHVTQEEMQEGGSERKGPFNILIEARYKKGRMRFIWKPILFSKKKYRLQE